MSLYIELVKRNIQLACSLAIILPAIFHNVYTMLEITEETGALYTYYQVQPLSFTPASSINSLNVTLIFCNDEIFICFIQKVPGPGSYSIGCEQPPPLPAVAAHMSNKYGIKMI